jgi:hypothetical protein
MSAFDDNFAYALVSSDNRTLKITGVNPAKYNALNTNWGAIPAIPALYAGPTLAYNGYGTPENAFSVIEIADSAFNGRTEFAQGTLSLPSTLQRIGNNAFNGVKIIGRLTIPSSVIYIGTQAFSNTMIDELVVENETNTDILAGVVDATRVANKETAARVASDAILTSVKVPKANPELTGVTTIPNAVISAAVITNATIKTANIATETANSAVIDYYEANVSDAVKNSRFTVSSVDGNLLSVNGVNENAAAIEIVLSSGVYRDGTALVSEIYSKLNSKGIAWVGGSTIAWGGTSFDPNTNTLKLGYSTDAPASVVSPALVIRTKFSKNGVAYDSSRLLGASGATVVSYEDGAFVLAYGNRNGLSFPLSVNLNTPTISVSGTATFDGSVSVSGQWNYLTQKPKYNAQVLATESYVDSRMKTIKGESLTSTVNTLAAIASAINEDPAFAVHVVQSQSAILNSITSIASVRSTAVSSLSTALSITASTLQSIDISISGGISSIIPVRSSQMESVSTSLNTTVSALQSVDLSISSALSGRISDRGSAMNSLSAAVSTSASLLQNVDNSIATGITNESTTRSHSISSISTSLVNAVSSLQTVDATLSNAITTASTVRSTAVSYLSSILSGTVPALQAVDTAFSGALTQQTANRVASVASLSSAVSAQISTTQSMNAVILPKISSGGLSQDDTTSTVFNMLGINVGESLTFVKTGGTFAINDKITIVYSDTDYLKGTVTGVAGSNVTFTVASKATSAVETQIYSTTGSFGDSGLLSLGSSNYIAPISPSPSFTNSSNYVVTTMSASRLRAYTNGGAQFYMNLLDGSNTILGTSPLSLYYTVPFDYLLTFKTAFVPRNSTLKQQFVFNNGINVRLSYDVSGAAYTTMKGYAVPYSSGSVQIDRNGALQNTRISAIDGLSNTILNTVGSLQAKLTTNQTDFNLNSTARIASLNSIVSTTTQSLVSVQSVVSTLASTLASATTVRSTNVSSLSTMISTNVSSFSSAIAAHSTTLSTQISNRSTQVLNAINTLVGGAPSSLDTLFEIATALDSGPQLYSMVSNTEMALTAETTARANEVGSVAGSLATAVATLQSVDTVLSTGISTAISARLSGVSSAANVLSTTVSTLQSVDAVLSTGISTATSARLSGVASVSGSLATAVSTLQSGNTVLSTGISTATSARASGVASVSDALLATVTTLQSVDTVLSAGISTATSARLSGVASVSGSLSATVSSHQSVMTLLSASFATLNAGINLTLLANTTAVDSAINGIVGTNAISAMDTLNEIAVAMNNNASIGTALETMVAAKGATSIVSSLSDNAATKLAQASYTSLSATVSDKANTTLATQLQSSVSSLTIVYSIISSEAHSLQSNMTVNTQITTQLADTIRQLDALYVYHGLVNANGTIKYKANTLSDPTIQTSSLVFTIDGNHQVTKITQVAAVQFDSTQVIVKYTSRGIEYTLNPIALTNRMYTFNIDSSGTTDYTANATAIVVSGIETALRLAPVNSLTIPKLALSSYTYAAPTVQTPYAATTWNDTTGKISQVLRVNFESGVQKLQVDGTTYDVAGTTEKVVTLEYYPGASGTWTAKALNSASKLESPSLTLSNVYNDYPQYAAPVLVEGTKAISLSGSTCTYSATFSSDANVVEVHAYNSGTSTYSKVQDLTPASANQFSVSITYDVSRIGQPLFKLKAATSASKRASDFSTVGNCEPFTFPPAVISGNLSYTNLNTDPKSFSVSATYTVHSMATVVQVINSGTGGTLMSPNPIVSNGSVSITFNFTEAQAIAGLSFYVRTNTNSVGLQSSSDAQVLKSQYDAPVIVAGTKVITQPSATELSYTAQFTSASSDGLIVYDADGVAHIGSSTGSSSPFSLSLSYNISKVGSVVFKVASKATATIRQSALVNIVAEDIPTHPAPLASGGITYGTSGSDHTAQLDYTAHYRVDNLTVLKSDLTPLPAAASFTQSILSTVGTTRTFRIMVIYSNTVAPLTIAVVGLTNAYGKQSAASASQSLLVPYAAPTISKTITRSGNTYTHNATYTSVSTAGVNVYNAVKIWNLTRTSNMLGSFNFTPTDNPSNVAFHIDFRSDRVVFGYYNGSWPVLNTIYDFHNLSLPTAFTVSFNPVSGFTLTYGPSNTVVTFPNYLNIATLVGVSDTVKSNWYDGPHFVIGTAVLMPMGTSLNPQSGSSPFTITSKYDVSQIGQTLSKVSSKGDSTNSESALVSVLCEDLQFTYAVPTISKTISLIGTTYTYNVTCTSVSTAGVNVYNNAKTWNMTRTSSSIGGFNFLLTSNANKISLHVDFRTDAVVLASNNGTSWIGNTVITDFHTLPPPTAFTVSFDTIQWTVTYGTTNKKVYFQNTLGVTTLADISDAPFIYGGIGTAVLTPIGISLNLQSGLSPFTFTPQTYDVSQIGQTLLKVSSKGDSTTKESALVSVLCEDIPTYANPVISGGITYGISGSNHTAQMNHTVSNLVSEVSVLKSDLTALPAGASFQQSIVSTTSTSRVISITITFLSSTAEFSVVVFASANAYGKTSSASTPQTAVGQHATPVLSGAVTYSGTGPYIANATYTVASTVSVVEVRKASDGTLISGATAPVSGTTATVSVPFADAINIVVVALANSSGRESSSTTQTLRDQYAPPVLSGGITYGDSGGINTAQMNYIVSSDVTTVDVAKPDGSEWVDGAIFFVNYDFQTQLAQLNKPENINKIFRTSITGSSTGSVRGTNTYRVSSPLSTAAVHAGVLSVGETKMVHLKIVAPINPYVGSTRNGIFSSTYNDSYYYLNGTMAFEFMTPYISQTIMSTNAPSRVISLTLSYANSIEPINTAVFAMANDYGKKSAASTVMPLLSKHEPPILTGEIIYGMSGANYTAQMKYTVNYHVTAVNVLNSDGSALPNGGSFTQSILSTTGTSRVISVTVVYATSMTVKVISQANAYGNLGYESATQLLQITYETPVAVSALRETSRGPREVFTTLYNNNVITLEDGNGVVSEYTTLLNPNVSMSDSANYPITFSMTFKTKTYFAYSNSSIAGKFSFSSIFIYWSLTTNNPGNVYFQINNGERVHICTIESDTYYTASITRTNDTTIIVKFVVTSTNAVIGSQTLVYSSTILNDNLRMDNINMAATGPNYHVQSGNSQATYNSGIVFGRGHISNVNISKSQMITMNIINEYYLAKSSKFRVFDNAGVQIGVDITTTVTKNGTQYFVAPANYTDDNIGQPVMKVKYISSGSPDLRDSEFSNAIIGVLLAQHAAPTITAGTKQITSFSIVNPDNRYQATNFPALGALSSWDMSIYFKATGGAGTWRGLVGAIYNGSGRNWGVWINNDNNVYWGWVVDNAYTMLPVALNVNYCLKITQTSTTIKFDLTNLDNSTTASETYNHANPVMGTSGPVTIGGWIYNGSETLIGSISAVNVGLYSLTASFDSPAAYSIYNVANQVITPTDVVLPNKFILRTGTSNWRQYVPLTIANESADPQGWDPDGQFNTSYSGNFIATQFSYFATYWLIRLKIPVGEYLSLDAYANGALIGYFIFGKRITDGELVGRLSKYNSGQLYTLVLQPDAVNAANTANATDAGMITRTANGLPDQMVLRLGNTDWKQYVPLTTASLLNVQSWTPDEQFYTNGGPPNYNTQQFSYFAHYWLNRLRVPVGKSMSVPAMAVQGAIGIFSFWKNDASTIKGNLSTYNGGATYDMPVQTDAATAGVAAQPKYLVSSAYYTAMVGQPIFKLRVPGTVSMLESEYLIVNGEETPTHAVPVISGTITYGTSGANSTAQMNYTVSSSVDTVSVLPTDSSAVNFTQSIVSTTGASRIISITITYTSNLSFKVIATPNAYGNQSGVSALQTLQPVIVPYSLDSLIVHKNSGAAIMPSPTGTGIVRTYHSTWANDVNLTDTTSPNTSGNNHHGVVIEMSLNGEWVVVGSPHHDNNVISSSNYGRSVVYRRNNINTENWVVAFGYTATYANAAHGSAVSIAGDGSVYAASEPNYYSNQGIIRLFVAASGPGYNDFYNIRNINQYIGLKYDPFGGYLNPGQTAESGYGLSFSGTGRYLAITSNRPGHYTAGNTCGVISTYNIYETETLWCFDPDPNVLTNNYRNVYPHSADDIVGAESSTRLGAYMKLSTDGTKLIATTETPLSVRVYTRTFFESTPGNFSKNERNNWSLVFSKEEPNMLSTTSVTMSQDGNRFAITTKYISASVPSMLKVYNMTDSTNAIRTFDFTGFNSAFKMGYTVSFSADGNVISTAEDARTDSIAKLFVWDVNTGNPIGNVIEAPKTNGGWNCRLSMSVDGTRFVMSDPMTGDDGIVRIYRIPRLAYAYISYITLGSGHATPQNATAFIRWNPSNYHTQDHAMQATANGMSTSSTTAIGTLSIKT